MHIFAAIYVNQLYKLVIWKVNSFEGIFRFTLQRMKAKVDRMVC